MSFLYVLQIYSDSKYIIRKQGSDDFIVVLETFLQFFIYVRFRNTGNLKVRKNEVLEDNSKNIQKV